MKAVKTIFLTEAMKQEIIAKIETEKTEPSITYTQTHTLRPP